MRGIADQREPLGDERARDEQPERKGAARPDHLDVAEMQAEAPLQLGVKFIVRQRDDALGLARRLGPHDRGAVAGQRQDRERAGRQEMLLGAAVMARSCATVVTMPTGRSPSHAWRCRPARGSASARRRRRPEASPRRVAPSAKRDVDRDRRGCRNRVTGVGAQLDAEPPSPWRPARRPAAGSRSCARTARPASTSPSKVRKRRPHRVARSLESVTTMSRIGCASARPRPRRRWSRTAAAPPPRSPRRARSPTARCRAPDRRPRP